MQIRGKYREAAGTCQLFGAAMVDSLLAALFPWACVLCGRPGAGIDLCAACLDDLPWLGADPAAQVLPGIDGIAAVEYRPPVDMMVTALKFHRSRVHGRVLGELLAIRIQELLQMNAVLLPDCLVPVPLHPRRLRSRGYNQTTLIASAVARALDLAVEPGLLRRLEHRGSQVSLGRAQRMQNPAGSFSGSAAVAGRRVAVIDDVITTGATLRECTRALLDAGAASVTSWAASRILTDQMTRDQAVNGSNV